MSPAPKGPLRQRGFTLIEVLMAAAVLAIVASAVYVRSGDVARQTAVLERRTLGQWLAADALAEQRLTTELTGEPPAVGVDTRRLRMAGRDWRVVTRVSTTTQADLFRVDVSVEQDTATDGLFAGQLTGFVGRH